MLQLTCKRFGRDLIKNTLNKRCLSDINITKKVAKEAIEVIPRDVRRQMRISGTKKKITTKTSASPLSYIFKGSFVMGIGGTALWFGVLDEETKTTIRTTTKSSPLGDFYRFMGSQIATMIKPFTDPSRDTLLPDWPLPGVPPHVPAPPTLILDLEDTLVHSEWDRRYGWRHAKRPGVDKLLETLSRYYEIVIFSPNQVTMVENVVHLLDKNGYACHRLYRDSTRFYNGTHVKDIERINRDKKRVIIIDDDPEAYQLQPENAIPIKPFTDGKDRSDTELLDLIPFLQAVAVEGVKDVPKLLNEFRDSDGIIRDLPSKYKARVNSIKARQSQKKQAGLGGMIRGRMSNTAVPSSSPSLTSPKF